MMEVQFYGDGPHGRVLASGQAVRLPAGAAELAVMRGVVWLTQEGDRADHLVAAGETLRLRGTGSVVIEALGHGDPVAVAWRARRQRARGGFGRAAARLGWGAAAAAAGALAGGSCRLAGGFAALARSAASMASRAQGRICSGESTASAGALQ
jgi:hypothetical protein